MTLPYAAASSDSSPDVRVNRQSPAVAIPQVNEPAVIADVPITEKLGQQSKSVLGEDLIHKRRLFFDDLHRAATWESIIIQTGIHRFRIELEDRSQSCPTSSVYLVQGLTQDELAAVGGVPISMYKKISLSPTVASRMTAPAALVSTQPIRISVRSIRSCGPKLTGIACQAKAAAAFSFQDRFESQSQGEIMLALVRQTGGVPAPYVSWFACVVERGPRE